MKRIIMTFFILLISFNPNIEVFAHSYIKSSSPADDEVVTKPLNTIEIIFETDIEKMGQLSLSHLNQTIEVQNVIIEGDTLTGQLDTPLENGLYEAKWKIVGEDGHPIEGTIKFSVELPEQSENPSEQEKKEDVPSSQDEEPLKEQSTEDSDGTNKNQTNGVQPWLMPAVVVAALLVSFWVFRKDKK
jgi:copper resistance protein C